MFNVIWPWQWKKIAEETLLELQRTRRLLQTAENNVKHVDNNISELRTKNAQLAAQVKAMSAR